MNPTFLWAAPTAKKKKKRKKNLASDFSRWRARRRTRSRAEHLLITGLCVYTPRVSICAAPPPPGAKRKSESGLCFPGLGPRHSSQIVHFPSYLNPCKVSHLATLVPDPLVFSLHFIVETKLWLLTPFCFRYEFIIIRISTLPAQEKQRMSLRTLPNLLCQALIFREDFKCLKIDFQENFTRSLISKYLKILNDNIDNFSREESIYWESFGISWMFRTWFFLSTVGHRRVLQIRRSSPTTT